MLLTYRLLFGLVVCIGISEAFTADRTPRCEHVRQQLLLTKQQHEPEFAKQIVKTVGVVFTLGTILAFNAGDAFASAPPPDVCKSIT